MHSLMDKATLIAPWRTLCILLERHPLPCNCCWTNQLGKCGRINMSHARVLQTKLEKHLPPLHLEESSHAGLGPSLEP